MTIPQNKTNLQKILPLGIGGLLAILLVFLLSYVFNFSMTGSEVNYIGANTKNTNSLLNAGQKVIEIEDKNATETAIFEPRKLSGGGDSWVLSLLETTPSNFSGKIIYDSGKSNYDINLTEKEDIYIGNLVTKDGAKAVRIEKTITECKDVDGNVFENTLLGNIGQDKLKGCAGGVIKLAE